MMAVKDTAVLNIHRSGHRIGHIRDKSVQAINCSGTARLAGRLTFHGNFNTI